jgi:hypothetical protein
MALETDAADVDAAAFPAVFAGTREVLNCAPEAEAAEGTAGNAVTDELVFDESTSTGWKVVSGEFNEEMPPIIMLLPPERASNRALFIRSSAVFKMSLGGIFGYFRNNSSDSPFAVFQPSC